MKLSKNLNYLRPIKINDLFRVGNNSDGGYVIPSKAFKQIDNIVSFGLGENFSFEKHAHLLNNKLNIIVYDHTVNIFFFFIKFFKSIKRIFYFKSNLINIINKFNTLVDYTLFFLINKHAQHIQNKIVKKIHFSNDSNVKSVFSNEKKFFFLVKIDIEGDEYKIIKDIKNFSNKIHILIVEFHNLDKKRKLFKESIIFLKTLFNIIHIHGNNYCSLCKDNLPEVVEFTFLNKRIYPLNKKNFQKNFPIKKLDFPSYQFRKDYTLKFQ